jgi:hypothetical protein
MTRLAQRVGHRARLAVLCVALAAAGVPAHAPWSVDRAMAAAVEVVPASRGAPPLRRAATALSVHGLALDRLRPGTGVGSRPQTALADPERPFPSCTPLFIAHRALLR